MSRKLFYMAIFLAIVSQGLASQTQNNTTDCNAESCVFPERDNSQFCSESLIFLDCVKDNVVDNRECSSIQRATGESVIILGKYAMLLNDCQDVPGTYCDLKQCPPPIDQGDDVCQKVRAYQKCLVDEIIENNQCSLFEKGAAVSKLVMTALNFTNCDEGEGHSWVEDNENLPPAPAVLLSLVHNDTETKRDLRTEENFKHFGAELCDVDKQLVNDLERKPFGPEREEDVKGKPRPEGVEQDENDEAEEDDESVETELDESIEEGEDEDIELEEDEIVELEEDESVELEEDESVYVDQDENLSESDDAKGDCDLSVRHFKADSDSTEESDKCVKAKQCLKMYKPVSYITGEYIEEEIKYVKSRSFSTVGDTQGEIRKVLQDTDGYVDIGQEDLKQLHPASYKDEESSQEDRQHLPPDSLTMDEATKTQAQHIVQDLIKMSIIPIETKTENICAAKSDPITTTSPSDTPTSVAFSRPLKFGLVARDGRPKKLGIVSKVV